MKQLLLCLYNIYFILLMIVPCNHTALYANLLDSMTSTHVHCSHNHSESSEDHQPHDHDSEDHHHSCTPFCACGVAHFVLNAPPFAMPFAKPSPYFNTSTLFESKIWAPISKVNGKLRIDETWHPPQWS